MATTISRSLPQQPNTEYLRKEAKRLARGESMQLAAAQRRLAHDYGCRNWAELMATVYTMALATGPGSGTEGSSKPGSPPSHQQSTGIFALLPLRELVAFPHNSYPIFIGRPKSISALAHAKEENVPILLVTQRDSRVNDPAPSNSDMYEIGTIGTLRETLRLPDGTIKSVIEGTSRARVSRFVFDGEFYKAEAEKVDDVAATEVGLESLMSSVIAALVAGSELADEVGVLEAIGTTSHGASVLADRTAGKLRMRLEFKQDLLEIFNPAVRLEILLAYFNEMTEAEEKWKSLLQRVVNTQR